VDGVDAYSTLGWFSDPLLNTFIDEPEADLAELIFHELGHRRLYVNGDTDFNEAYATEVAAEGLRRWFAASSNTVAFEEHETARIHDRQFVQLVMQTRDELGAVYADASLTDAQKLQRKQEVVERLRTRFALVRKSWGRDTGYDHWINGPINNAKLNTVSAYYELGPAFHALLLAQNGDIEKFYEAVATLAKLPLTKRHEALLAYLKPVTADNSH
jgi:predicted aminopeptidase